MTYLVKLKNERLNTLADECGLIVDTYNSDATQSEIEYFAEQLIRECSRFIAIAHEIGVTKAEPENLARFLLEFYGVNSID